MTFSAWSRVTPMGETQAPAFSPDLTDREQEIVTLVVAGDNNRQIATKLFLSVRTVEGHLYRVYEKLGITSRQQLRDLMQPEAEEVPAQPTTDEAPRSWGDINRLILAEQLASVHHMGGWLAVADEAIKQVLNTD